MTSTDRARTNHPPLGQPGVDPFTYQALLTLLGPQEIGWLTWSWWKDGCADRQMTGTGAYSGLTPYGHDLVHNLTYGLLSGKYAAERSPTLP